ATRIARGTGYRDEVFSALRQAHDLEVPQKDLADLRSEAIACLGDFVGLEPVSLMELPEGPNTPSIWWATLHPTDPIAAIGLSDGTVILKDLHSTKDIARFECGDKCIGLCFADSGNTLLSIHVPGEDFPDLQWDVAVAQLFVCAQDGTWVQGKTIPIPHAKACMATTSGFYIGMADLASGSGHLMELLTGDIVHEFRFPVDASHPPVLDLSADGRLFAASTMDPAGSNGSILDIWDITLDQHLIRLEPDLAAGTFMKFSPDGRYLAFLSASGGLVYSTETWEPIGHLTEQFVTNPQAIFLPHSPVLAYKLGSRFFLWDFEKKEDLATFEQTFGGASADGKTLVTYDSKRAWLYRLDTTNERLALSGHTAGVPAIAFSPDGSHLASVSKDRTLRVWESFTGHQAWEGDLDGQGQGISYSPDGRWIITADYDRDRIRFWNAKTKEYVYQQGSEHKAQMWSAEFTPDNRYLVTGTAYMGSEQEQGAIVVWANTVDNSTDAERQFKFDKVGSFPGYVKDVALAPDSKHLAFVNYKRVPELYLWDVSCTQEPRLLADNLCGIGAQNIGFTPDSRHVIAVDENRFVVTYDVQSGQKVGSFPTRKTDDTTKWHFITMHTLSPDGAKLAMSSRTNLGVDLWDYENGRLLYSLPEQEGFVYYFAWSPDGQRLAVSRSNGDIDIWNIAEIERVLTKLKMAP
ncbi:WD40 repeat domain-containing protein, partial [Planctomycetota bacterium]